jgi:hypothetical protein
MICPCERDLPMKCPGDKMYLYLYGDREVTDNDIYAPPLHLFAATVVIVYLFRGEFLERVSHKLLKECQDHVRVISVGFCLPASWERFLKESFKSGMLTVYIYHKDPELVVLKEEKR